MKSAQQNLITYLQSDKQVLAHKRIIQLLQETQQIDTLLLPKVGFLEENEIQTVWDEEQDELINFEPRTVINGLLRHYETILVGALSNYFPPGLTDELTEEIIRFLELSPIDKYYNSVHKYFLPQGIIGYCFSIKSKEESKFSSKLNAQQNFYNEFLILNRTIANDINVLTFLKAFDNYNEIDTGRILSFLASPESLNEAFDLEADIRDNNFEVAAIGAINFAVFVSRLMDILERTNNHPVLQSVLWHFYGYYFDTMGEALSSFYKKTFGSMRDYIDQNDVFEDFGKRDDSEENLYSRAFSIMLKTEQDLMNILTNKRKYSLPFERLASPYLETAFA